MDKPSSKFANENIMGVETFVHLDTTAELPRVRAGYQMTGSFSLSIGPAVIFFRSGDDALETLRRLTAEAERVYDEMCKEEEHRLLARSVEHVAEALA